MSIKTIAIGNRMMGDDGIALYVAEYLGDSLSRLEIEMVIGETDINYCISRISSKDELIIIDSSCRGGALGSITSISLREAIASCSLDSWQHDRDLIKELKIRGTEVCGLLLCIEICDIDFRWSLSAKMQQMLPEICDRIYDLIFRYRGE